MENKFITPFLIRSTIYGETVVYDKDLDRDKRWLPLEIEFWRGMLRNEDNQTLREAWINSLLLTEQKFESIKTLSVMNGKDGWFDVFGLEEFRKLRST